jgi:UDPglucose 6-dehydrogenase
MLCLRSGGLGIVARLYDPEATEKARALMPQVEMPDSAYEAAKDAEALVIATEWNEFQDLDWVRIRDSMTRPLVLDARNLLNRREMKALGFEYYSVGRPE